MKKKISPEVKCYIALGAFNLVALSILLPISIVQKLWGLTIGWAIGFVASFLSMIVLFLSGKFLLNNSKNDGKGAGLSILFYFIRLLLIGGAMVICAILAYVVKIEVFKYSIFTSAGSALPSAIIIAIFYHIDDEPTDKKIDEKSLKEENKVDAGNIK